MGPSDQGAFWEEGALRWAAEGLWGVGDGDAGRGCRRWWRL